MFNVRFDMGSVRRRFKRLREKLSREELMRDSARFVVGKLATYIFNRSKTRHKVASRFGVKPTGILEFRASGGQAESRGGGRIYWRNRSGGYSIFISGVPFIQKAFRALHIRPKRAKALTIPVHREAVHKKAADLKSMGWLLFRPSGQNVLMGRKNKRSKPVCLYALVKSAKIPRDARLLPSSYLMNLWTENALKEGLSR